MALTLAQRWKQKILAQEALRQGIALADTPESSDAMRDDLHLDVQQLRDMERREQREEYKLNVLLPKWLPQVEQYLAQSDIYPCPALVYCMIWSFDIGDFERCLELASVVVDEGQPMPENFSNSAGAFVADNFRDWVEAEYGKGNGVEPYFSQVFELITRVWRLNEELTARWFVLAARLALRGSDGRQAAPAQIVEPEKLTQALALLQQAEAVSPAKSGAKTLMNKVVSRLRALGIDQ